jgi:hypothetical protein
MFFSVETTVELSTREDCFLTSTTHLLLEVTVDGQVIDTVNLLSQESDPWVWEADDILALYAFLPYESIVIGKA